MGHFPLASLTVESLQTLCRLTMLAEVSDVKAWSQVPLTATLPSPTGAGPHTLTGVIDGALAPESQGGPGYFGAPNVRN